jgi:hypothetical protein
MGRGLLLPHARRLTLLLRPTGFSTTASVASTREPLLHVCVVGSGPAGFYTAEKVRVFGSLGLAPLWGLVSSLIHVCSSLHGDSDRAFQCFLLH